MVVTEGNGGGRTVLIWWVSIHVNSNVWPEKQLVNGVNVRCFYVVIFFLVKLNMPVKQMF